jgi:arginyl-tRNA synthetase
VAGPGFLNFTLQPSWKALLVAAAREPDFGVGDIGENERVQVEFVSANPTGPLHVGHGRWAAYGDALARLLEATGYRVSREYYVNDTGGQVRRLGESLLARRRGERVADEGYQGDYIEELAKGYGGADDAMTAGAWAAEPILLNIRSTLDAIGVHFDEWFSQASIQESAAVAGTIELLRERGAIFEDHGAVWLRSTSYGDSRDRVLVKSDGEFTYLAGDLAYHRNKFLERGFDRVIDILGADHHGQVASLLAGTSALGVEEGRLEVILGQLVSVARGRLSKRSGNIVALGDVVAEIGPDSARFLFLQSSIDTSMTLDLDVAIRQDLENPVYYVQMAHARVCSIAARARERGIALGRGDAGVLSEPESNEVAHVIEELPEAVNESVRHRAPHKLAGWCRKLAGEVHRYYHRYPVLGAEPALRDARFALLDAARVVLGRGLALLGVSAPTEMTKLEDGPE